MNKDEIKKAFAICCGVQDCTGCPILDMEKQNGHGCKFNLFTSVIDTVSEQEKEIERLKADYAKLQEQFAQYQMASDKEIRAQVKQAKIDVLNKAKEKLDSAPNGWAYTTYIDELIEEVQNGEDKG